MRNRRLRIAEVLFLTSEDGVVSLSTYHPVRFFALCSLVLDLETQASEVGLEFGSFRILSNHDRQLGFRIFDGF